MTQPSTTPPVQPPPDSAPHDLTPTVPSSALETLEAPDPHADATDYVLTAADWALSYVYGDHLHANLGRHITDGPHDDRI